MKSFFPDVNVWLALAYRGHQHNSPAVLWFDSLDGDIAYFCRVTQLSFLRLLCHSGVMGEDLRTQNEAWQAYDALLGDPRVSFHSEPDQQQLESAFRRMTSGRHSSSKQWPDAYLAAFAEAAGFILTTFDRGLHHINRDGSLWLR